MRRERTGISFLFVLCKEHSIYSGFVSFPPPYTMCFLGVLLSSKYHERCMGDYRHPDPGWSRATGVGLREASIFTNTPGMESIEVDSEVSATKLCSASLAV